MERSLAEIRGQRFGLYDQERQLRVRRLEAEHAKGEHFRAAIFEKSPRPEDLAERERLDEAVKAVIHQGVEVRKQMHELRHAQNELVHDD